MTSHKSYVVYLRMYDRVIIYVGTHVKIARQWVDLSEEYL